MSQRFVCIHGHFYQPPREDPRAGEIERQPSAGVDHDWNCRIARECYIPNGRARLVDGHNRTMDFINNYAFINFDFGPTLLSWYEKAHPEEYRLLLEADRESLQRLAGHGNAIAQAYNHMILPLANPRDKVTQVYWGIEDFRSRFKREPEALWLPETACDEKTLRVLIDHGLKYAILAPQQAAQVRPFGRSEWTDVSLSNIDTRRPYRWFDGGSGNPRFIDLFFYHDPLSQGVAFGKLMSQSSTCAQRIEEACDPLSRLPQLVSLCSDGETYGHHERFADMGLAHLLKYELPSRDIPIVNFGYFLSHHPPTEEVEIKRGPQGLGTAWSCAHGVGRWMDDCGCASEGGQQKWRKPLREAFDWLALRLAGVCERKGTSLFLDFWQARNDYIHVMVDPSPASVSRFLSAHLRLPAPPEAAASALNLMEIQKYAMYMYTSCGWFFSEISGLEATQNIRYAAHAIELARPAFDVDVEPEFVRRLKEAPSNLPEFSNGAGVYEKLTRSNRMTNTP